MLFFFADVPGHFPLLWKRKIHYSRNGKSREKVGSVPHSQIPYQVFFIEHRILKPGNALVGPTSHSTDKETEAGG